MPMAQGREYAAIMDFGQPKKPKTRSPKVAHAPLSPLSAEGREIIEAINNHARSDETIEDIIAIGDGLVSVFGWKATVHGKLGKLSKRNYPPELKPEYSWVRRLMKLAMDERIRDPDNWRHFPNVRSALVELSLMTTARIEQGKRPDPQ